MAICRRQRHRRFTTRRRHPFMRMSMIATRFSLSDNVQQITPLRMQGVCYNLKSRSKMSQTSCKAIAKASVVFAGSIYTGTGEDETGPAACIFDFFVNAPDSPILSAPELVTKEWMMGSEGTFYCVNLSLSNSERRMLLSRRPLGLLWRSSLDSPVE